MVSATLNVDPGSAAQCHGIAVVTAVHASPKPPAALVAHRLHEQV